MANFEIAYQLVQRAEGGYQRLPQDRGNYNSRGQLVGTNWGINARVYEDFLGYPPSAAEMRQMSAATARNIYYDRYWRRIQGDRIVDQELANIWFDGHVNHGMTGIKMMQRVLSVDADGIVGDRTITALNRANPARVYVDYKEARRRLYHWLAANREGQSVFLRGWLNRLETFTAYAGTGTLAGLLIAFGVAWYLTR